MRMGESRQASIALQRQKEKERLRGGSSPSPSPGPPCASPSVHTATRGGGGVDRDGHGVSVSKGERQRGEGSTDTYRHSVSRGGDGQGLGQTGGVEILSEEGKLFWAGWGLIALSWLIFSVSFFTLYVSKWLPPSQNPFLEMVQRDWYYCLLIPCSVPTTFAFIYVNWVSMKFFRHA
uniref:Uncharacterized protein n=1 Tax=Chromera velia CCMP2878 TaxID=1169474 RepID=A0A0G4G736_9ALVE|eukprot:Cvel_4253.t1-p1 / transcript=Cvel_4253.t1 / gene=Cvel_4253 / organism=Chromera_velia_CCMP2878 / gene_product=hypothetical protein / transcript_product=hypothetical protein / location=Cvel_scaffold184:39550-40077(-) / protein_length=176 / sequence_SO=supercontig / SO=protein_coding / is_pseudo=false